MAHPLTDEGGGLLEDSDGSYLPPKRDKGQRHWDDRSTQPMGLIVLEHSASPCTRTTLMDSRVNFRLGSEGLQAEVDYRVDPPSLT